MMTDTEREWRAISGYEGIYSVSNDGIIWSHRSNKVLKPINQLGYHAVHLAKDGQVRTARVHRLVACAFIANPECKPTVNHKNEIKTDNRVENLEWATSLEQNVYGTRIKRAVAHTDYRGRRIDYKQVASKHDYEKLRKLNSKPIKQLTNDGVLIKIHDSLNGAARELGISAGQICNCAKGNRITYKGYRWEYA